MAPTEPLSTPEAKAWLAKHLANAPERSPEWMREVAAIYAAGRAERLAQEQTEASNSDTAPPQPGRPATAPEDGDQRTERRSP
jgi:hypothetical protein